ncbi:MAG: protein kinase, partial [Lactobacillales bacterium]|nr:protein kinase [Lactobacillales bacterium]
MLYSKGQTIYKYELIKKIGSGQFGEVWIATDRAIKASLAIKILDTDRCSIDERLLEAQIGNRLEHSNLINIKNADVVTLENGLKTLVVITMPYYSNGSVVTKVNAANFL